ncbi:MAG: hypothetical protein QM820_24515 [Minicystis sp.]
MRDTSPFLLASALVLALGAGLASSVTACGGSGGTGGAGGEIGSGGSTSSSGTGGTTPTAACFDYTSFDATTPAVHFQADVLPILRLSCGLSQSCHGNENGPGGQHYYGPKNSDPAPTAAQIQAIFDQSVDKPSVANPTMKVIAPGDPANSFMLYKLDGDPSAKDKDAQVSCDKLACAADKTCLDAMPQGGPQLPADKRDTLRRWIAQGAKND